MSENTNAEGNNTAVVANDTTQHEIATAYNAMMDKMIISDYTHYSIEPSGEVLQCGHEAMARVVDLINDKPEFWPYFNSNSNFRRTCFEAVKRAAVYCLSVSNKECYFMIRGSGAKAVMEMSVFGNGHLKMLSKFGKNVKMVYPAMEVYEGDEYKPVRQVGITMVPPELKQNHKSQKIMMVVLPVEFNNGYIKYAEVARDEVKGSIYASAKQNMTYKVRDFDTRKAILEKLKTCNTVDEMLALAEAAPYINGIYTEAFGESMVKRKMIIKATKMFELDLNPVQSIALVKSETSYSNAMAEIAENENSTPLVIDGDTVDTNTGEVIVEAKTEAEAVTAETNG